MTLRSSCAKKSYTVNAVSCSQSVRARLASMGIVTGTRIYVIRKSPRGDAVIFVRSSRVAVGEKYASYIFLTEIP